ncbi:MAG: hypothetical protein EA385_15245 [Salinarimonadaceae bacterium]|nr:MAG: hypothetical protein EA385_15245 [Salinarimonadaceae bacterium]
MTTITPNGDATERALSQYKAYIEASIASGDVSREVGQLTNDILATALRFAASSLDRGGEYVDVVIGFDVAMAACVASVLDSLAKSGRANRYALLARHVQNVSQIVTESWASDDFIVESAVTPEGGTA